MIDIKVTPEARAKISELKPENQRLRVAVIGGGCSGLSYQMRFEPAEAGNGNDHVILMGDFEIIVDPKSALFLGGSELAYTGGLEGRGFEIRNPNAKRTCGCGLSFSC